MFEGDGIFVFEGGLSVKSFDSLLGEEESDTFLKFLDDRIFSISDVFEVEGCFGFDTVYF